MMRGVFVMGSMVFCCARSVVRAVLGAPERRVRMMDVALSCILCLTAVHVPLPDAYAAPVAAPVVAPAATKAIVETAGALIAYYFTKKNNRDSANGDQLLQSSTTLVHEVFGKKEYRDILMRISLQITGCIARSRENAVARKSNKQDASDQVCLNLIGFIVNTILKNKSLTNDIVNYYNKQKNNRNSGWDGTFVIFCVTQVLVGAFPEKCKNYFMVQNATSSPTVGRGGTRSSAGGGNGDNGGFDRPYSPRERFNCNVKINGISVCIPDVLQKIKQLNQKIRQKIQDATPKGKPSVAQMEKINQLKSRMTFIESLESDVLALERELKLLFTSESARSTTNDAHQKSLHAYLDSLMSSFSLIAAIIEFEIEAAVKQSNQFADARKVIDKLLEMQNGPLQAISAMIRMPQSMERDTCIENFRGQLTDLRTIMMDVDNHARKYMQAPTQHFYDSFIIRSKRAINSGIEIMNDYKLKRNQCFPKR